MLHSATLLPGGGVLVVAGRSDTGLLASAERYDLSNSWRAAAALPNTTNGEGAVLLVSGKVLQLGDSNGWLYDPAADSWTSSTAVTPANIPHGNSSGSTALLLADGRVLAAGGYFGAGPVFVYDPSTGISQNVGSALVSGFASVTEFPDGAALAVGGATSNILTAASAQLISPQNSTPLGSHAHSGAYAAASMLMDGRLLVTGGTRSQAVSGSTAVPDADLFDPTTDTWSAAAPMGTARVYHVSTALANGSVLVTGGSDGFTTLLASAELSTTPQPKLGVQPGRCPASVTNTARPCSTTARSWWPAAAISRPASQL